MTTKKPDPSPSNTVDTILVSGGVRITVDGHVSRGNAMIPFPVTLQVGKDSVSLDRNGVKELVKLLLDTL